MCDQWGRRGFAGILGVSGGWVPGLVTWAGCQAGGSDPGRGAQVCRGGRGGEGVERAGLRAGVNGLRPREIYGQRGVPLGVASQGGRICRFLKNLRAKKGSGRFGGVDGGWSEKSAAWAKLCAGRHGILGADIEKNGPRKKAFLNERGGRYRSKPEQALSCAAREGIYAEVSAPLLISGAERSEPAGGSLADHGPFRAPLVLEGRLG